MLRKNGGRVLILVLLGGEGIGNPEPVFWIKPFSKRFDVSVLVFLDSFATNMPEYGAVKG